MSSLPVRYPVCTNNPSSPDSTTIRTGPEGSVVPDDFERLVRLASSNERLFAEQQSLGIRLRSARAYLANPRANPNLARANLQHLRTKYSGILALLRANRREAQALLAIPETEPAAEGILTPHEVNPSPLPSVVRDCRLSH